MNKKIIILAVALSLIPAVSNAKGRSTHTWQGYKIHYVTKKPRSRF